MSSPVQPLCLISRATFLNQVSAASAPKWQCLSWRFLLAYLGVSFLCPRGLWKLFMCQHWWSSPQTKVYFAPLWLLLSFELLSYTWMELSQKQFVTLSAMLNFIHRWFERQAGGLLEVYDFITRKVGRMWTAAASFTPSARGTLIISLSEP